MRQQVETLRAELGVSAAHPGAAAMGDVGTAPGTQDEMAAEAVSAVGRYVPIMPLIGHC